VRPDIPPRACVVLQAACLDQPLDYVRGARFGQATRNLDYPTYRPGFDGGRTVLLAFGMRF